MIYLDTSAAVKLRIDEPESAQTRAFFDAHESALVSSTLLAVELNAVADRRLISTDAANDVIERVALVALDDQVAATAIALHSGLRTLDALHLATAVHIGDAVEGILCFDAELNAAASRAGIPALRL